MEPNKRRRLCGKQAPIEGLNTRDTRNALQTFIRDRWVAQQMTARNLRGHEQRQRLRVEFSSKPDKSAVLEGMRDQVPQNLRAAARSLLASWTIETPIVQEPVLLSYRGCGTMFRYSGSWSKIEDASITLLLTDQKPSIDEVCQLLRANAEVLRLWSDFQDFVKDLQRRFHLDRATAALELHSQVSLERKQAAVHLHLMWDSRKSVSTGKGDVVFRGPHVCGLCAGSREILSQGLGSGTLLSAMPQDRCNLHDNHGRVLHMFWGVARMGDFSVAKLQDHQRDGRERICEVQKTRPGVPGECEISHPVCSCRCCG